jgi:putative transcriptional regulator
MLLVGLAATLLPASLDAALPRSDAPPQAEWRTGQLLIAAPSMPDPRFQHTVVLVVRHDRSGALGIVINRPVGEEPLEALLLAMGVSDATATGNVRLFSGGPVDPEAGFIVHSADYERQETVRVNAELAVTTSADVLRDMAHHKGPRKVLVALGYTGWGPGQLEAELARNDWLPAPADPDLVFDTPRRRVWDAAMARRGQ